MDSKFVRRALALDLDSEDHTELALQLSLGDFSWEVTWHPAEALKTPHFPVQSQ